MEYAELARIAGNWDEMTHMVLDLKTFSCRDMQDLLKETYAVLTAFHKEQRIPKLVSKILLNMDGFLYFTSFLEGNDVPIGFYHYQILSLIANAMKKGFFASKYACPYPKLQIHDTNQAVHVIDLEKDHWENLF